ncbi:DUF5803 family protein [Methanorbis furvi]|uniref:Uncharacterized protein n=1 Tax=Methanorbis furvi TaxID=3028299 RepID=A0AAE4MEB1_9EURY|nr:hypothetical protein [Methanocorpusculaceae archaeon Ag1]
MRSANRDRPDHRSTALRAVTAVLLIAALLVLPVSANSVVYAVSEDGSTLFAEASLVNQSGYLLMSPGFIGEGGELKANNVTLTAENGTVVNTTKKNSMELTFPEGNYTLTYDAPIDGNLIYAQYLVPFNTTVLLPPEFHTNNLILGPVRDGGVTYTGDEAAALLEEMSVDSANYGTVVVWTESKDVEMRFYPVSYDTFFPIFVVVWLVIFGIAGYRYWRLRRKPIYP